MENTAYNIIYTTTEDNNHNVLGIINRFMRTIRDMVGENRYINEEEMNDLLTPIITHNTVLKITKYQYI